MAPTIEHAVTTVRSTQVVSRDKRSILVEAGGFTPMRWFLERAIAGTKTEDIAEPPKKRRRLGGGSTRKPAQHIPDAIKQKSPDDEIPIHRVTLDLHFPETLSTRSANRAAVIEDVEFDASTKEANVSLYGFGNDGEGAELRLMIPGAEGAMLLVHTDGIAPGLRDAVRKIVSTGRMGGETMTSRSHPATTLRCTLKHSVGRLFNVVRLEVYILWCSGSSAFVRGVPVGKHRLYPDYELLAHAFTDVASKEVDHSKSWTPQDFYDSVHVPAKDLDTKGLYDDVLSSELYPFQQRALSWMLHREGVSRRNGRLELLSKAERQSTLSLYTEFADSNGEPCYVNFLQGVVSRENPRSADVPQLSGGLLAEEMGLGKTVELTALIALHKRPDHAPGMVSDGYSDTKVTPSGATLIVTPASILQQWKSELTRHAPALKVFQYTGIPCSHDKEAQPEKQMIADLANDYDVVLVTYQVLTKEVHFAEDPPERNMRHARRFERRRSPLIQIQWWRICLDEAQMVESGVTAAARVACRLPRVNSWAVSGTPLRKNVEDILGLLIFLRYQPFSDDNRLWGHLIVNHRHLFRRICGEIALRHTKSQIRDELRLPPQKRVVITVPFSAVEQQHYSTLFAEMCEDVGLNGDGSPKSDDWDPREQKTVESMRAWLVRLRQTCLHPQVGGRNRKALGRGQGPLRTVAEVLESMIEQNQNNIWIEERSELNSMLLCAHIVGNNGADDHRSEKALETYKTVRTRLADIVSRLVTAKTNMAIKDKITVAAMSESEDEDSSSESAHKSRRRGNLRMALHLQHVSTFFAATACFQIKSNETLTKPDSERFNHFEKLEADLYEEAKQLRRLLLKEVSRKADNSMRQIQDLKIKANSMHMPKIKDLTGVGGIENRRIIEKADNLFDVIRAQAQTVAEWRGKMAEYLLKPLVDEDEEGIETTGEEYEDSTKQQDELFVYFDAIKAMQADMNTFVTGEDAPLTDHEVKTLINAAKKFLDPEVVDKPMVHAPELLLKLLARRNKFRAEKEKVGSVRGLIQEARALQGGMEWQDGARSDAERSLVQTHLVALNKIFNEYTRALNLLEKEIDLFRLTQNQRLDFYRQLQELSDAVAPYKEELDTGLDEAALRAATMRKNRQTTSLAQMRTENRYLLHLRDESENKNDARICVICQCAFENGVLTVCGHQYCKECINLWYNQHRTCPVCKKKLVTADFHDITYKPQELKAQEEMPVASGSSMTSEDSTPASPSQNTTIYSSIDPKLLQEIKSIDLPASYGTKIDTLGRHLHWLREHDAGAKSIVFSQYREFLDVLGTALSEFRIGYSRLGRSGAVERFRHDASVDCLLLDAKTDSSGLTLVNATHVFLCEPLLQTAVELQAIARVHRIGQTRPTTVWGYLVTDTVEESIYELSVARRLAHVQSQQQQQQLSSRHGKSRSVTPAAVLPETAIDAANSEELQSAPLSKLLVAGKGGGEVVGNEYLWQCLFGKAAAAAAAKPSVEVEAAVGRHLRAEAAVLRRLQQEEGEEDAGTGA